MPAREGFPQEPATERVTMAFAEPVKRQLDRILGSRMFVKAPSLSGFLGYIVERSLSGSAKQINEYSIGVDVFRRGEAFDPNADTIVRVQARRLRAKLQQYYASEGSADPIVIDVPKGQYCATFRQAVTAAYNGAPYLVGGSSESRPRMEETAPGWPDCLPLPLACSSFMGRDKELAELKDLLRSDQARLVTVTGAGGSGKTRLGLHAAAELDDDFPGGIYLVELASITDPRTVASTLGQRLGLRHTGGRAVAEALQVYLSLSIHRPTLLFLDNFEQVAAAAPLLTSMLASCRSLKILVTSRCALRVAGEHEYLVLPLPPPDPRQLGPVDELARNPAVCLFLERARAGIPGFSLCEDNAQAVAEICARLDGLPLALELAAARLKILTPASMLARFGNSLDLLTCGPHDLPVRQQTLRRTIDWSHSLLTGAEQRLFRRLAVFPAGCTLESAEAVCNARCDLGIDVLEGISSLVEKNLLQRKEQEDGEMRFSMLQTIREYALERLTASGEAEFTRRAHAAYCLVLAEQGAAETEEGARASWLTVWDAEHENLRDALDWLIETDSGGWALRLGTALFAFWQRREHLAEARERLEAILELKSATAPTRERARGAWYAAILADHQGDFTGSIELHRESLRIYTILNDRNGCAAQLGYLGIEFGRAGDMAKARQYLEKCVTACRELGDQPAIAGALSNFAEFLVANGERSLARSQFEEALSIFRKVGNVTAVGWSLNHLGDIAFDERDFDEAGRFYREGCDIFTTIGDGWGIARSLADLGRLASEKDDQNRACSLLGQALQKFSELRHMRGVARTLEELARVAIRTGDPDRALTLCGAADALRRKIGEPKRPAEQADLDRALEPAWRKRNTAAAREIWAQGLRMPLEQVIPYALGLRLPEAMSARS
jgi:predicted ATPase/Tfp pilus assembly protein PilF